MNSFAYTQAEYMWDSLNLVFIKKFDLPCCLLQVDLTLNLLAIGQSPQVKSPASTNIQIYAYDGTGWKPRGLVIRASDYQIGGNFGATVTFINSNILMIGSPTDGYAQGSANVYIFNSAHNSYYRPIKFNSLANKYYDYFGSYITSTNQVVCVSTLSVLTPGYVMIFDFNLFNPALIPNPATLPTYSLTTVTPNSNSSGYTDRPELVTSVVILSILLVCACTFSAYMLMKNNDWTIKKTNRIALSNQGSGEF